MGQPKETLYQVIPTEEGIPGDEEVILVESVVRKNGKGKIPVMLAHMGNKTVKVPKREQEKGPENNSRLPNFSILDPRRSEQPSGCRNSKSQTFRDIGVARTASSCHISLSVFFCLPGRQTLLLYCLTKVFQ